VVEVSLTVPQTKALKILTHSPMITFREFGYGMWGSMEMFQQAAALLRRMRRMGLVDWVNSADKRWFVTAKGTACQVERSE
jgi:hypothetical protein